MKRLMMMLLCSVALSAFAAQPDRFVRYVEATGSQYVDTGVVGRYGTKAECKVEWMALEDRAFLACGNYSSNTRFYMCYCSSASGNMFTAQRTGEKVNYDGHDLLFVKKRVYTYTSDFSALYPDNTSTNTVTVDGNKARPVGKEGLDTKLNLFVFACNNGSAAVGMSKTRCYGLKIWQDGTLVRDFLPCVNDGRAALYDAVGDKIYYSASGTDLVYDVNCDVPDAYIDYVESFGNSYIDTGIIGRSGTSAKMELALMGDSDQALLASRNNDNRFYLIHNNGSGKWGYGYGAYKSFGSFEQGKRYCVDSSLAAGSQVVKISESGSDATVVAQASASDSATVDTGRSMYVFCCNYNKTFEKKYWGSARVYSLRIFQDGTMVRDFKPCLKYGQAALYDDVSKKIFYPSGDPLGFDNSVAADPDELVFVDYIEADGFTHLDTGVSAQSPVRAAGTFSWTAVRSSDQEKNVLGPTHRSYLACGCYNSSSDANRFYLVDETSQKPWIGYGNNSQSFGSVYAANKKYAFDASFAAGAQTFSLTPEGESATVNSYEWAGEASGMGNLYLFACNDVKNKKPIYQSEARCYGLKIFRDGSSPVRDFKPCVKDGQAALYDTVSRRIFYPVPAIPAKGNTGRILEESALSPVQTYLEYVESDGTQYIDTGVVGKDGTVAEFIETSLTSTKDTEECFLGSFAGSLRFYMWYHAYSYEIALGYAGTYWRPNKNDPDATATQGSADVCKLDKGDTVHARVSFAEGAQTVTIIDDEAGTRNVVSRQKIAGGVDTGVNLYLFARNDNGTAKAFCKSRFRWLKLRQNGNYVRVFQPVRLKNGLVGLLDHIDKNIHLPLNSNGEIVSFGVAGAETDPIRLAAPTIIFLR